MIGSIPFKNIRSVTFNCVDFVSQIKRGSRLRHAIYARKCIGLTATPCGLTAGQGLETLTFPFRAPTETTFNTVREFPGDTLRWAVCAPVTNATVGGANSSILHFGRSPANNPALRRIIVTDVFPGSTNSDPRLANVEHVAFERNTPDNRLFIGGQVIGVETTINGTNSFQTVLPNVFPTAMFCALGRWFGEEGTRLLFPPR